MGSLWKEVLTSEPGGSAVRLGEGIFNTRRNRSKMEELRKAVASAMERLREGIGQGLFQAGTARGRLEGPTPHGASHERL
jgi:hypothetical protein